MYKEKFSTALSKSTLRVGIILPEDKRNSISLSTPSGAQYLLKNAQGKTFPLAEETTIHFDLTDTVITADCPDTERLMSTTWIIERSDDTQPIFPKSGVLVKNVISGREFHWRKQIDVYLPGKIEIKEINHTLLLVNELPIEDYVACVATSEMNAQCPEALIASQTIIARSWILANVERKHQSIGFDVCNDDCCQRYQGSTNLTETSIVGANTTAGQVLIYDGSICDARYSKSCGGVMESFENVWKGKPVHYFQIIPDAPKNFVSTNLPLSTEESVRQWIEDIPRTFCSPHIIPEENLLTYLSNVDEAGNYFRWNVHYTQEELTVLLNEQLDLQATAIKSIQPIKRGGSGRILRLNISYLKKNNSSHNCVVEDQYTIRKYFHRRFLYSSAFFVKTVGQKGKIPQSFVLKGAGWGHGVGYCQIGALGMSLQGYTTEEILYHYLPGTELVQMY